MAYIGESDFTRNNVSSWELRPLYEELRKLREEVEQLKRTRLSEPYPNGCIHTFPIWMVIPPGGCTVTCPICGEPRFINGPMVTW